MAMALRRAARAKAGRALQAVAARFAPITESEVAARAPAANSFEAVCGAGAAFALSQNREFATRRMSEGLRQHQEFNVKMEKFGIKIERNVIAERMHDYRVSTWGNKWTCKASKFPWKYDTNEIIYLLKGRVNVYPDGENDYVQIVAGDIVIFPMGLSCTWDCLDDVEKIYKLYI